MEQTENRKNKIFEFGERFMNYLEVVLGPENLAYVLALSSSVIFVFMTLMVK